MPHLLVATKNSHKTREIADMLGTSWTLTDLCAHPEIPAPEETGATFSENASLKALAASTRFEGWVLADDSGLCVDALQGDPGIYSARFAGRNSTDAQNRAKLLRELASFADPSDRSARFHCVLALAKQGRIEALFEGVVEGYIQHNEQGHGGFGYDPLFVPEGFSESFGLLPAATKNAISHRAKALSCFLAWTTAHASVL